MTDAAKKLMDMSTKYIYVNDMSCVFEWNENRLIRPMDFLLNTGNSTVDIPVRKTVSANGVRTPAWLMDVVPSGKAFLDWPARPSGHSLVYRPGADRVIPRVDSIGDQHGHYINMWKGWAAGKPVEGDISPFLWVLDNVFGDDPMAREFIEHWFFYPIRNPGAKLYTVCLVVSRLEGIGKTFPADMLAHHVYGLRKPYGNANVIGGDGLNGAYNSYLVNKQFILADDLASSDVYQHLAQLKGLVTNQTLVCKEKYVPEYTVDNLANFYLTSNEQSPFKLTDQDRRFFVHEPRNANKDPEKYHAVRRWFEQEGGGAKLLWHAQNQYEQGAFDPRNKAPITRSKLGLISAGQTDAETWVDGLKARCHLLSRPFVTPAELLSLFQLESTNTGNMTPSAMGRVAGKYGWRRWRDGAQIRLPDGKVERVWVVAPEDQVAEFMKWDPNRVSATLARDLHWKDAEPEQSVATPIKRPAKKTGPKVA
jgi:hypothetical protein